MKIDSHAWEIRVSELYMQPFKFDIDLQKGEEVIIRSAEQKGVVEEVRANSETGLIEYAVNFQYGSVYIDDAGYDSESAWLPREALRKIK